MNPGPIVNSFDESEDELMPDMCSDDSDVEPPDQEAFVQLPDEEQEVQEVQAVFRNASGGITALTSDFQPSARRRGKVEGYVFTTRNCKTGYYKDQVVVELYPLVCTQVPEVRLPLRLAILLELECPPPGTQGPPLSFACQHRSQPDPKNDLSCLRTGAD